MATYEDGIITEAPEIEEEGLDLMPDGYGEGDDFFSPDTWGTEDTADEQDEEYEERKCVLCHAI